MMMVASSQSFNWWPKCMVLRLQSSSAISGKLNADVIRRNGRYADTTFTIITSNSWLCISDIVRAS